MFAMHFKFSLLLAAGVLLGGCGLAQRVADGSGALADTVFRKRVNTLHLDLSARAAANTDRADMSGLSLPTLVRIYQLQGRQALDQADYPALLAEGGQRPRGELLDAHQVVVKPGAAVQLNVPLARETTHVAVVALFHRPDTPGAQWRLVLERDQLHGERPRLIELGDNVLTLKGPDA
jgi:type VI secretion system protein VasD